MFTTNNRPTRVCRITCNNGRFYTSVSKRVKFKNNKSGLMIRTSSGEQPYHIILNEYETSVWNVTNYRGLLQLSGKRVFAKSLQLFHRVPRVYVGPAACLDIMAEAKQTWVLTLNFKLLTDPFYWPSLLSEYVQFNSRRFSGINLEETHVTGTLSSTFTYSVNYSSLHLARPHSS